MRKVSPLFFLLVSTVLGFSQSVTLNIVNQNENIADPWVTFVQSLIATSTWGTNGESSTSLLGPALNATAGATTLQNGTSYQLSVIGTTIDLAPNWAGNIFFSDNNLASVLGQSGQSPAQSPNPNAPPAFLIPAFSQPTFYPTNPNGSVTSDTNRYNYIELGGGSNSVISPDITYINYYSVPLQLTRSSDGATRGAPSSPAALAALPGKLAALSGSSSNVVVQSGGETVRIISPNNGAAVFDEYPSFNSYITSAFDGGAKPIQLTNQYSGHGSQVGPIANQTYTGESVTFDGVTLIITGSSSNADVGEYTMTSTISAADLSNAIYASVLTYDVVYATGSQTNANTGDNDVFSAVSRDLLAGFSFGFINSNVAGDLTSQQWMGLSYADAFANAQPGNPYYNQYAAAFADTFTDVYTFPFNDFLTDFAPVMSVNTGEILTVTLLGSVPEPGTAALIGLGAGTIFLGRRRRL